MVLKRLRFRKTWMPWLAVILVSALSAQESVAEIQLTFGVYTADKPTAMVESYRPVLSELEEVLSEELQKPVSIRFQMASTYQKGIEALVTGKVDFAMVGPASYVEARYRQPNLEILALESKDGSKTFNGIVCVHEDSDIQSIADLRGRSFAFGNERSTIGRYLSQELLTRKGVTAKTLKSFDYLGRHDRVAHSVAMGKHDAGALKEGTYNKFKKKGYKLRTLTTVSLINRPWVASAELDKNIHATLKEAMLNLDASAAFKAMGRKQFIEARDVDFAEIRHAININPAFFDTKLQPVADYDQR